MQLEDLKQSFTQGSEELANYLERKFVRGLQLMGERRALRFARMVAPLFTLSKNGQRRQNLQRFFGPKAWDKKRQRNFEKGYYDYLARFFAEQACLAPGPSESFRERVTLAGENHVEEALRAGRGAVVISGHVGNYRFIPAALGQKGYKVTALVRSVPLAGNERYFIELAGRHNIRIVFTYQNVVEAFRTVLRNNEVIYVAFDTVALDNSPMWFPFGHASLELSRGPALLACRYGAPVLYGVAPQEPGGRTSITLKPVEPLATERDTPSSPDQILAAWLRHLYADILRYPEQWWEWPFQTVKAEEQDRALRGCPASSLSSENRNSKIRNPLARPLSRQTVE